MTQVQQRLAARQQAEHAAKLKKTTPLAKEDEVTKFQAAKAWLDAHTAYLGTFKIPTGARRILATIASLVVMGSTYYWAVNLVGYLTLVVLMATGIAFLAYLVAFLGICLAIWMSLSAAAKTYKVIVEFDMGAVTKRVDAVNTYVLGFFKRTPKTVAPA